MLVYEVIFHAENILNFYLAIGALFLQSLGFRVEFRYFFFFFFATLHSLWGLSSLTRDFTLTPLQWKLKSLNHVPAREFLISRL